MKTGEFEYREGVVMNQILLADEINITSPKTKAGLLEAMAEIVRVYPDPTIAVTGRSFLAEGWKGRLRQNSYEAYLARLAKKYGLPRKPDQIIHPYMFGHPESKKTCLWLKNLPKLEPTKVLPLPASGHWNNQTEDRQNKLIIDSKWIGYNDPRTKIYRSKTYPGIATAIAQQWGDYLLKQ